MIIVCYGVSNRPSLPTQQQTGCGLLISVDTNGEIQLTEGHDVRIVVHRTALHMDLVVEVDSIVRYLRNKHIGQLRNGNNHCIVVGLCPFSDAKM